MTKWLVAPCLILLMPVVVWVALPTPIDAVAYEPPEPPGLTGPYEPNQLLDRASILGRGLVEGPEDVDVDSQGRAVGATADGRIVRVHPNGQVETLAETGGRPLGLHWDAKGNLIICDAFKGLLSLSPSGELKTLVTEVDGIPLGFTDDLDIAQDGSIYFSDASVKYDQRHYRLDMYEARPWGRLIRFNPATGKATTLTEDLYFANGVALSKDESFLLVAETYRYRIIRYWLKGPRAGKQDVFIDNLPGFPDGVSSSGRNTFWVALATTRNTRLDAMHPYPLLKNLIAKLPAHWQPQPRMVGLVLELDEQGTVIRALQDANGDHYPFITSVQERNGELYLGSLYTSGIGTLPLKSLE